MAEPITPTGDDDMGDADTYLARLFEYDVPGCIFVNKQSNSGKHWIMDDQ